MKQIAHLQNKMIMKTNARITIDGRRPIRSGAYPVRICITIDSSRFYTATGIHTHRKGFDPTGGRNGAAWLKDTVLNAELLKQLQKAAEILHRIKGSKEYATYTGKRLEKIYKSLWNDGGNVARSNGAYLVQTLRQLANTKTGNTKAAYMQTAGKVEEFFSNDILMADFTRANLEACAASWRRSLSVNSVAAHLKNIRAAFNYTINAGMCNAYPFRGFRIIREAPQKRALTIEQIQALLAYNGTAMENEARDMFFLSLYLIGCNGVDFLNLQPSNINAGRLEYRRRKTHRLYSIKLHPAALTIIEKYKGKNHLLCPLDKWKNYTQYIQRVNKTLQRVVKRLPAFGFQNITIYWARHTWATFAAFLDISDATIAQSLGHTSTNPVTNGYITRDARKVDEANAQIINYITSEVKQQMLKIS